MFKYHILSLKETNGDNIVWWGPNNRGYTSSLGDAGLYTQDQVMENLEYYNNHVDTIAVPVVFAENHHKRVVPIDKLTKLKESAIEYVNNIIEVRKN